jgi:chromosome segregation ATPase
MKIDRISYKELKTGYNYNNTSVGAEAQLEEGETPEDALDNLKMWVKEQLGEPEDAIRSKRSELIFLKTQLEEANKRVANVKEKWDIASKFLERLGVIGEEIPIDAEQIPF